MCSIGAKLFPKFPNQHSLREGFKKKKKKLGIFPKGGGVPSDFGSVSQLFLFVFKHGLNHPEMQRNFVHPLVTPGELVNLGR